MLSSSVIKHLNQLQQKKFRNEFKEFLVEGVKGVSEALHSETEVILVVVDGKMRDEQEIKKILEYCNTNDIVVEFCGRQDIGKIKTTDTFPGVLAVVAQNEVGLEDLEDGLIICLDEVKDPGNLGTIIRTADWFGMKNILLSENTVDPFNPKVVRSTMGSIFRVNIFESNNLLNNLEKLKKAGYKLVGLCMNGENLDKLETRAGKVIYIFGSESHGIRPEIEKLLDKKYTIPAGVNKKDGAESLNVSIAAGIVLHQVSRKK